MSDSSPSLPFPSSFKGRFCELTVMTAPVDEEDRGEEEEDGEAAEGSDEDDPAVWGDRSRSGPVSQNR